MIRRFLLSILILMLGFVAKATHNRAGEIVYKRLNQFTYEITVITYTKESSTAADRCFLEISYGDGSQIDTVFRVNGGQGNGCDHYGESIGNDVKKNIYTTVHSFPGASTYLISVEDPNRNANVVNIPNSDQVTFYIETVLSINPFLGANNSPVLLNPPIDDGCVCKPYLHNPGAYDPDGDSLSYRLVDCKANGGVDIPGYTLPSGATINPYTGDLYWLCPPSAGEYNFAILIEEWKRSGNVTVKVGSVLRDMQVTIDNCLNEPPVIADLRDTCIIAGNPLAFDIKANDPDANQVITLTSTGQVYLLSSSSAYFSDPSPSNPVTGSFYWSTQCSHVKVSPYTVSFRAIDDDSNNPLVDYESISITVIGPPTPNLRVQPQGTSMLVQWDSNPCSEIKGYKIYRRQGSNPFVPDYCETGLDPSRGYSLIATINSPTDVSYVDNNGGLGLNPGNDYCYRIVAFFDDGSQSIVSNEDCASLVRDIPMITHASVLQTDLINGSVYVAWSKPVPDAVIGLDTTRFPGPYSFKLLHSTTFSGPYTEVDQSVSVSFAGLNDTTFIHQSINTVVGAHFYRVAFYGNGTELIGTTPAASTPYLSLAPNDNRIALSWSFTVPWDNYYYYIYKKDPGSSTYLLLDSTIQMTYTDDSLLNGVEYCYYVITKGHYFVSQVTDPLLNNSQENCIAPMDKTAPCPPNLSVVSNCDDFFNRLSWKNKDEVCSEDIVKYKVYRNQVSGGEFSFVGEFIYPDTTFVQDSLLSVAGCYIITAIDTFANESINSDTVCVDNCPYYELPNVFTPNQDGSNDLFIPLPDWKYIKDIDLTIYNRWGNVVFKTNDPYVLWEGKYNNTGPLCPDGVYYYVCIVNEIRLEGTVAKTLSGYVHLFNQK